MYRDSSSHDVAIESVTRRFSLLAPLPTPFLGGRPVPSSASLPKSAAFESAINKESGGIAVPVSTEVKRAPSSVGLDRRALVPSPSVLAQVNAAIAASMSVVVPESANPPLPLPAVPQRALAPPVHQPPPQRANPQAPMQIEVKSEATTEALVVPTSGYGAAFRPLSKAETAAAAAKAALPPSSRRSVGKKGLPSVAEVALPDSDDVPLALAFAGHGSSAKRRAPRSTRGESGSLPLGPDGSLLPYSWFSEARRGRRGRRGAGVTRVLVYGGVRYSGTKAHNLWTRLKEHAASSPTTTKFTPPAMLLSFATSTADSTLTANSVARPGVRLYGDRVPILPGGGPPNLFDGDSPVARPSAMTIESSARGSYGPSSDPKVGRSESLGGDSTPSTDDEVDGEFDSFIVDDDEEEDESVTGDDGSSSDFESDWESPSDAAGPPNACPTRRPPPLLDSPEDLRVARRRSPSSSSSSSTVVTDDLVSAGGGGSKRHRVEATLADDDSDVIIESAPEPRRHAAPPPPPVAVKQHIARPAALPPTQPASSHAVPFATGEHGLPLMFAGAVGRSGASFAGYVGAGSAHAERIPASAASVGRIRHLGIEVAAARLADAGGVGALLEADGGAFEPDEVIGGYST